MGIKVSCTCCCAALGLLAYVKGCAMLTTQKLEMPRITIACRFRVYFRRLSGAQVLRGLDGVSHLFIGMLWGM